MQKVFRVTVDISKKIPAPAFEVNTNDLKSVKLEITITNGQSLLDLTDVTPRINIRKPDNEVIFQDCEIVDAKAGKVQIVLENQAYLVPGTHTAEIACYKGNEITAITGTFSYKSVKGIMNDEAVESKSEFTAIDRKIEEARKLLEDIGENGVGVDEQARQKIEEVTTQLVEIETKKVAKSEIVDMATKSYVTEKIVEVNTGGTVDISSKADKTEVEQISQKVNDIENIFPKGEKTGDVISFSDATAGTELDITAKLMVTQNGTGEPSPTNIRPIVGLNKVEITHVYGANTKAYNATPARPLYGLVGLESIVNVSAGVASDPTDSRTFNGSESWNIGSRDATTNPTHLRFSLVLSGSKKSKGICSHFKHLDAGIFSNTNITSFTLNNAAGEIWFCVPATLIGVGVDESTGNKIAAWKSWVASQNANGKPLQVVYELSNLYNGTTSEGAQSIVAGANNNQISVNRGKLDIKYKVSINDFFKKADIGYAAANELEKWKNAFPTKDYVIDPGKLIARLDRIDDWTLSGDGRKTLNRRQTKNGNASLKLDVTAGGTAQLTQTVKLDISDVKKSIILPVFLHDRNCQKISVFLYTSSTSYYALEYGDVSYKYLTGWHNLFFAENNWTTHGTPDLKNITSIVVRVRANSGVTCSVSLGDLMAGVATMPKILIRFDDGHLGTYTKAFPIMNARNIPGVLYNHVAKIVDKDPKYCTKEQLTEMYNAGWDISNHTYNHRNMTGVSYELALQEVKSAQDWLIENGFHRSARHFAVPNGVNTLNLQQALRTAGVLTSSNSIYNMYTPLGIDTLNIPAEVVKDVTKPAEVISKINACVQSGKTLVLMFHDVAETIEDEYDYLTSDFTAIMDHIANNDYAKYVVTASEYYEGLNR